MSESTPVSQHRIIKVQIKTDLATHSPPYGRVNKAEGKGGTSLGYFV